MPWKMATDDSREAAGSDEAQDTHTKVLSDEELRFDDRGSGANRHSAVLVPEGGNAMASEEARPNDGSSFLLLEMNHLNQEALKLQEQADQHVMEQVEIMRAKMEQHMQDQSRIHDTEVRELRMQVAWL